MCSVVTQCRITSFKDNAAAAAAGLIVAHISKKLEVVWHNMLFSDTAKLKCPAGVTTAVLIKTVCVVLPFWSAALR